MNCPACATELPDDNLFCESCGASLTAAPATLPLGDCTCGALHGEVDEEGFCLRCGRRVRRPASDHIEEALSPLFAAVSDRGLRHDRNEDRFSLLQTEGFQAMVVCDGVSATRGSEIASSSVAEGMASSFSARQNVRADDMESAMREAISAGAATLAANTRGPEREGDRESAPSTTVVAALILGREAILGWVGDSRAYWIDASGTTLLTRDHSWVNEVVAAGQMSAEEAEASPRAHGITRWIGADAGPNATPDLVRYIIPGAGVLLLCTDGLWNYTQTDDGMGNLLARSDVENQDALGTARLLVQFANEQGGRDNITAAMLRFL